MPFIVYFLGFCGFGPQKWVFEGPLKEAQIGLKEK